MNRVADYVLSGQTFHLTDNVQKRTYGFHAKKAGRRNSLEPERWFVIQGDDMIGLLYRRPRNPDLPGFQPHIQRDSPRARAFDLFWSMVVAERIENSQSITFKEG